MASTLEKQLNELVASARVLQDRLESDPNALSTSSVQLSISDMMDLAQRCTMSRSSTTPKEEHEILDRNGTDLWNLSTKLIRTQASGNEQLLKLRHLAYLLLDTAQKSIGRNSYNCHRLLKVANKAAKCSLDYKDFSRADSLFTNAAKYEGDMIKLAEQGLLMEDQYYRAIIEYRALRVAWSSETKNLPVALLFFDKATAPELKKFIDMELIEQLCRITFKIGKELLGQGEPESAADWFKRAFNLMESTNSAEPQFEKLQFSIMQGLAQSYMAPRSHPGSDPSRARNVVDIMIQKWPSRLSVHGLNIDLASAQNENPRLIQEAIKRMITMITVTDESFKAAISRITELRDKDCKAACECIDFLIKSKLLEHEHGSMIERAFVTRMWMVVGMPRQTTEDEGLSSLQGLMEEMSKCLTKPLDARATYASQVLLWKKSEVLINRGNHRGASDWCKVALHPLFDQKGELNRCKIARRIITCAIEAQEFGVVHEIYQGMATGCQRAALTQFLMFKQALRTSNIELGGASLRKLQDSQETSPSILYACALEAQDSCHKDITIQAFKTVLDKLVTLPHADGAQVPVLLRCTIRLVMAQVQDRKLAAPADISTLCVLFEKGSELATKAQSASGSCPFSHTELDWFSRNAYNLAIRACDEWEPIYGLRFAGSCLNFIKSYNSAEVGGQSIIELTLRETLCNFVCASVCTVLARRDDSVDEQTEKYRNVRSYAQSFRTKITDLRGKLPDGVEPDLDEKLSRLVGYDFEACIHLEKWDETTKLVKECIALKRADVFEVFGDMTLCSKASPQVLAKLLQSIIDASWILRPMNREKLARWTRCLIQLSIVNDPSITEHLVQQVIAFCNDKKSEPYPNDELEWLTPTLFNLAVDMQITGDIATARKWAEYALSIASLINDAGKTHELLQANYMKLKF